MSQVHEDFQPDDVRDRAAGCIKIPPLLKGGRYVAAVIDLFSRRVVGWSMSAEMTAQLVGRRPGDGELGVGRV